MAEPSPRPWKWDDNAEGQEGWLAIYDAEGRSAAGLGDMEEVDGRDLANADTIVQSVNHYPALLAAARAVVEGSGFGVTLTDWTDVETHCTAVPQPLFDALRSAVEAAEGGEGAGEMT